VLTHGSRQLPSWLIFNVGQNRMPTKVLKLAVGARLDVQDLFIALDESRDVPPRFPADEL